MWRHIAQSAQGLSHLAKGIPCQDSSRVLLLAGDSDETLVACVADGASSAEHGAFGSTTACESIIQSAASHFASHRSFIDLQPEDVVGWCEDARRKMSESAESRDSDMRQFATTLCVAIVSSSSSHFFQIGDGAIILRNGGVWGVVFWPQSGEYVNSTNFLTSHEYRDYLQFLSTTHGFSDVALLTDGIERLALRFDSLTPHLPFFEPLFRALRAGDESRDFAEGLRRFLQSDPVQHRSYDDKTLILASRISEEACHTD